MRGLLVAEDGARFHGGFVSTPVAQTRVLGGRGRYVSGVKGMLAGVVFCTRVLAGAGAVSCVEVGTVEMVSISALCFEVYE